MTKSCVKIWVSKMTGDYDRYLTQAVDRMKEASNKLADDIQSELHGCRKQAGWLGLWPKQTKCVYMHTLNKACT